MTEAGVNGIVAGYSSAISLATSQEAAKTNTPHVVDVGVSDEIVTRGLANTFRFAPGYGKVAEMAVANLDTINKAAGSPAKTAMIVHEESLFGTGTAKLLSKQLPEHRHRGRRSHQARQPDARLHQHRAADQVQEART